MSTETVTPAHGPSVLRILAALLLLFVPPVALAVTPFAPAAELFFVGVIPALVGLLHGRRFALGATFVTAGVVAMVLVANPYRDLSVVLMVAIGLLVGASALRGWQTIATVICSWPAVLLVGVPLSVPGFGWASVLPGSALLGVAAALAGGLWTVLIGYLLLRRLPTSPLVPLPAISAVVYGIALALLLGATTLVATTWGHGTMAGWVLLTILVIARPGFTETWRRVLARSLGTVLGGAAAALLALAVHTEWVLATVGFVALALAILLQLIKADYALYSVALTAAVVLINSRTTDLFAIDVERVGFTVIGAIVTALLLVSLQSVLRRHVPTAGLRR